MSSPSTPPAREPLHQPGDERLQQRAGPALARDEPGRATQSVVARVDWLERPDGSPCGADIDGFSLHAAVRVEARDRKRLERLWRDGTTHAVMSPLHELQLSDQVLLHCLLVPGHAQARPQ
jgi:hypothetical protein